ncbi:hypothetical protein Psi01_49130 [Planobispora siamensis]|uniref:Uncharacterized protein n=1 Tax=Planobispora siamensis TaxID=936338 RepID=A0A8J3SH92_9ACTN|nr:hypothetical protein Psi01_49130 [Planobispora siamensis]
MSTPGNALVRAGREISHGRAGAVCAKSGRTYGPYEPSGGPINHERGLTFLQDASRPRP